MGSYGPTPNPVVLPPEGSYNQPPQPVRRPRRPLASSWATYLLVGINCAVFLAMAFRGINPMNPTSEQLLGFGADSVSKVLFDGEWWRIVTAMFVHGGLIHLATNMWCLWNLGLLAEPLMSSAGVLAVYLLTGAAGNLLSTFWSWYKYHDLGVFPASVGASGAVFGIAGALIVLLKSKRLPIPEAELKRLRTSVIYFAAINLVIGLTANFGSRVTGISIDNSAHIGGFACGLLFAVPMIPRIGSPRNEFQIRLRAAVGMIAGVLVLFSFYLSKLPG
jgi:rhomboid protease GluP